jgi:peroxiredoxin
MHGDALAATRSANVMLRAMHRLAALFVFAAVSPFVALPAVRAQATLDELQRQFANEAEALSGRSPTPAQRDQLLQQHLATLQKFVADRAKGDDRWNGRLMLADLLLQQGNRDQAAKALADIDAEAAPPVLLLSSAAMAQRLNKKDLRDRQIEAALKKDVPLRDRLAMARLLMIVLHEPKRGEDLFQQLLAAAKDDEDKALIRFHRADTMRDREDLPDNTGFEELDKLAKDLPATYWGSVAKDRLRATELRVGDEAIPFRAKTNSGADFALADQLGKAVVLVFWTAADRDNKHLVATLAELLSKHGDRLIVLGVNLDRDRAVIDRAVKDLGITFPVVGQGLGIETDAALRWMVEGPVVHVIDSRGKIKALGLHAGTADARRELQETVGSAISP